MNLIKVNPDIFSLRKMIDNNLLQHPVDQSRFDKYNSAFTIGELLTQEDGKRLQDRVNPGNVNASDEIIRFWERPVED